MNKGDPAGRPYKHHSILSQIDEVCKTLDLLGAARCAHTYAVIRT
jgi:hypothetical protein